MEYNGFGDLVYLNYTCGNMKGVFFSLILVFLLFTLIAIVFMQRSLVTYYYSQTGIETRANAMNGFYNDLVEDSKKAIGIVGKRAIASAISYVVSKGVALSQANKTLVELITNGTIEGEEQPLMNQSTIVDWEKKMEDVGSLEGFDTELEVNNVVVQPFDSFDLKISYSLEVNLSDKNFKMNLSRIKTLDVIVDINGFEDPLYPLYTYGRAVNLFIKTPHWMNYSSEDLTNLQDDLNNSYYHPSKDGGSFLDRLEGKCVVQDKYKITNTEIGLESFVNKDDLESLGLPVDEDRSNIDYIYFCELNVQAYQINGMPSNFRLDNQTTVLGMTHLQIYNVTERVIT